VKLTRATSVEDYKLVSSYENIRKTLLLDRYADRLDKPLAFWALPNDRRLPLAFLGRTIKDLLSTPFEELSATPGIGQKKINSFVKLLSRATKEQPPQVPFGMESEIARKPSFPERGSLNGHSNGSNGHNGHTSGNGHTNGASQGFDATLVSEALWVQWRDTVKRHKLGAEKLGRVAPSLQNLPTVIWNTPLEFYAKLSVADIRALKTHGEKRVRVVLECFYGINEILGKSTPQPHLVVRMVPKFIDAIEAWIATATSQPQAISLSELRKRFVRPLVDQLKSDASPSVFPLVEGRLGLAGSPQSVRVQSKSLGVTRARVYQLFEECGKVMDVRWPEGAGWCHRLRAKLLADGRRDELALFDATIELFFPDQKQTLSDNEPATNGHSEE
jgi:hypothetical protein